jgi:hypothetical protein
VQVTRTRVGALCLHLVQVVLASPPPAGGGAVKKNDALIGGQGSAPYAPTSPLPLPFLQSTVISE